MFIHQKIFYYLHHIYSFPIYMVHFLHLYTQSHLALSIHYTLLEGAFLSYIFVAIFSSQTAVRFELVKGVNVGLEYKIWRFLIIRLWSVPSFMDRNQKPMLEMVVMDEEVSFHIFCHFVVLLFLYILLRLMLSTISC